MQALTWLLQTVSITCGEPFTSLHDINRNYLQDEVIRVTVFFDAAKGITTVIAKRTIFYIKLSIR